MKILASLAIAALGAFASARQVQLSSVTSHETGMWSPRTVHGADFDGDGIEDVLVGHQTAPPELVLMRGLGQHRFSPLITGPAPDARAIVSGRFNADSSRDAAWLRDSGEVRVALGAGGGLLGSSTAVATVAGGTSIAAGDLDTDGKLDLVVTSSSTSSATILRGDGVGGFALGPSSTCGANPAFAQLGNLDGDAYRDLAVANVGVAQVSVLFGGPAGFGAPLAIGTPSAVVALDLGDLDADGAVDLVVCSASSVSILRGNGAGSFGAAAAYTVGAGAKRLVVTDATGDGLLDVVVSRASAAKLEVLENRGAAGFALGASVPVAEGVVDMSVGDFDGDGFADVALATNQPYDNTWIAWGPLQAIHEIERKVTVSTYPTHVRAADIDADGDVDVLASGSTTGFMIYRNTGSGFGAAQMVAGHGAADVLEVLDVDGDGRLDVVTANDFDGYADVFLGQPGGTLQRVSVQRCGRSPVEIVLADFDGDGRIDCAAANRYHHNVSVRRGLGGGLFTSFVEVGTGLSPFDLAPIDADADGDLDLVVATFGSASPGLVLLRNGGAGTFANAGMFSPRQSQQIEASDLDGDGDVDLALSSEVTQQALVLRNDGPSSFSELGISLPAFYPHAIEAADLDGDGDLDLAVGHAFDDSISLVEQISTGVWVYAGQEPAGTDPVDIHSGDLDGDGIVDLAVASFYSFDVSLFLGAHALFGDVAPYCTAKINSLGCTPNVDVTGVPSASSPLACTLVASKELNLAPGLFFYGFAPASTPFGGGFLCVAPPLRRTPLQSAGGSPTGLDCSGSYSFDWNAFLRSGSDPALVPGSTAFTQFWSRDGASPIPMNLTSAVRLTTAP